MNRYVVVKVKNPKKYEELIQFCKTRKLLNCDLKEVYINPKSVLDIDDFYSFFLDVMMKQKEKSLTLKV